MTRFISNTPGDLAGRLEFLADSRGIYGLTGPARYIDTPRLAVVSDKGLRERFAYILRPDRLDEDRLSGSRAMQTLPRQCAMFRRCAEYQIIRDLGQLMVDRAGLRDDGRLKEGSRTRYWGLVRRAARIANHCIGRLIEDAADQGALKLARRFPLDARWPIYREAAREPRFAQLAATFPLLAVRIAGNGEIGEAALDLVRRGHRLRDIATLAGLPMALRRLPPAVTDIPPGFVSRLVERPDLLQHMPSTSPAARRWLLALDAAWLVGGPFVDWVARHGAAMGRTMTEVRHLVDDLRDFAHASYQSEALSLPQHVREALGWYWDSSYITRRFHPDQSLETVLKLSAEWHEAVAGGEFQGRDVEFPQPWVPAATVAGYQIEPITTRADLHREGAKMRHCVGSECYSEKVLAGSAYLYSIRQDGDHIAVAELLRNGDNAKLGQVRGPCNAKVDKTVIAALRRWLRQNRAVFSPPQTARDEMLGELVP